MQPSWFMEHEDRLQYSAREPRSRSQTAGDRPTAERPYGADEIEFLCQVAGQISIAIEKAPAYDEISELRNKVAEEKLYIEEEFRSEIGFERIIGTSPALRHVLQLVETVASSDSTVLLLGETGTGKELIARAIHERSRRKERTFVKLKLCCYPTGCWRVTVRA